MRMCCVAGCTSPSCSGQDGDGRAGSQFVGVSTGCYSMHANVSSCWTAFLIFSHRLTSPAAGFKKKIKKISHRSIQWR